MPWKYSSVTEMTFRTDESLMLTTNSLPMEGMMLRTACGSTTVTIVCQCVMPMERAASVCPRSMEMMPPRTISAMYAPVLMEMISMAACSVGSCGPPM